MQTLVQNIATFFTGLVSTKDQKAPSNPAPEQTALKECINFYVAEGLGGVLQKRPGTLFAGNTKNNNKVRLLEWIYNNKQSFIVELGDGYARFWTNNGQIGTSGIPQEIAMPYTSNQLDAVRFAYSRDALYLIHGEHAPMQINRTGSDIFSAATIVFTGAPAAWGASNYPRVIGFVSGRLVLASSNNEPTTVWLSKSGEHTNFTTGTLAADAMEFKMQGQQANDIKAVIQEINTLMIITRSNIMRLSGTSSEGIIKPDNFDIKGDIEPGGANIRPQGLQSAIVHVGAYKRALYDVAFYFGNDRDLSVNLNIQYELTSDIIDIVHIGSPSQIWCMLEDGTLRLLSYDRNKGLIAWSKHVLGGDGKVEAIAATPGTNGDRLWLSVSRQVNGITLRTIEYFEHSHAHYVDCAVQSATNIPTSIVFGGLGHMEGKEVSGLFDKVAIPENTIVTGGLIALPHGANDIVAGYAYTSVLEVLPTRDIQHPSHQPMRIVNIKATVDAPNTEMLEVSCDNIKWRKMRRFNRGAQRFDKFASAIEEDTILTCVLYKSKGQTMRIRSSEPRNAVIRTVQREYGVL